MLAVCVYNSRTIRCEFTIPRIEVGGGGGCNVGPKYASDDDNNARDAAPEPLSALYKSFNIRYHINNSVGREQRPRDRERARKLIERMEESLEPIHDAGNHHFVRLYY